MTTITHLSDSEIAARIDSSPQLASRRSINSALSELINADNSFTSQIAEIIRRDPSLTSRLLKMVNSVFFGLSRRVNNIEEAIFYLGLRQIRELALATPVIEDFDDLSAGFKKTNWKLLWQHSIGTAIFTREILAVANVTYEDETDYIVGLVHNVGKIVIAFCFPDELQEIISFPARTTEEVCLKEREAIGWDHAKIGAYYLKRHRLSPEIVETTEYHNRPEDAPRYKNRAQPCSSPTTWSVSPTYREWKKPIPYQRRIGPSSPVGISSSEQERKRAISASLPSLTASPNCLLF